MKVSIGLSTSSWWVSNLIREATNSRVSHAFFLLEGTDLGDLVLEMGWNGERFQTKKKFLSGSTYIVRTIVPKVDLVPFIPTVLDWLNEQYNYEGILGMEWVSIGRRIGKRWNNPLRNSKSMFCSEMIAYVLQLAKEPGTEKIDPQSWSPADIDTFYPQGV